MTPDRTQLFLVAVTYHDPSYTGSYYFLPVLCQQVVFIGPPHKVDDDEVTRLFGK
jgi:hypothetical protein